MAASPLQADRTSPAITAQLAALHHPTLRPIDMDLSRLQAFMELVGKPHQHLPPVFHIAGTNGKGSLSAYVKAVMQAAGYKVHRYTSPHLVRFNERIELAGSPISDEVLLPYLSRVYEAMKNQPLTFFEATTVAAFLAFCEHAADLVILETGMGGRLDATNLVASPILTAITPIGYDHCEFLGETLAAIAGEKAGILKVGTPCAVAMQDAQAMQVIEAQAIRLKAPLFRAGREWQLVMENGQAYYRSKQWGVALRPSLAGKHQLENAALAVSCIECLQPHFPVTGETVEAGISQAVWPARLQPLTQGRYARLLTSSQRLWLDGGHNPSAGEVLGEWARDRAMSLIVICGMLANKDARGFLAPLADRAQCLIAVPIPGEAGAMPPEALAEIAASLGIAARTADSVEDALRSIAASDDAAADVLICGSLYLAGHVLAENVPNP